MAEWNGGNGQNGAAEERGVGSFVGCVGFGCGLCGLWALGYGTVGCELVHGKLPA